MKQNLSFIKKRQFLPGPTQVWSQGGHENLITTTYHRSEGFKETLHYGRENLAAIFGSINKPLILTCSGTGAMESAVLNLTAKGDEVLVVAGGKFGQRWAKLCREYECKVHLLEVSWGEVCKLEELKQKLEEAPHIRACFFQGTETSTAVSFPVEEMTRVIKEKTQALVVVDTVTSLCSETITMDKWQVDCMIGSSQKGFGAPAGLSFVALSDLAIKKITKRPKFYFDYRRELENQDKGVTSWTPAMTLIEQLNFSLQRIREFGIENLRAHHKRITESLRCALKGLDLKLLAKSSYAKSVTGFYPPDGILAKELLQRIQSGYKVEITGGQEGLKDRILRIGHLGFVDPFDIISCLSALEFALKDLKSSHQMGTAVRVFMENYYKHTD